MGRDERTKCAIAFFLYTDMQLIAELNGANERMNELLPIRITWFLSVHISMRNANDSKLYTRSFVSIALALRIRRACSFVFVSFFLL